MKEQRIEAQASTGQPANYRAYLVRLWRDQDGAPWRVTLRPVLGTEQLQFADVASLCDFLNRQTTPD
jgi:hypothetical protein